MECSVRQVQDGLLVSLPSELDHYQAERLRGEITGCYGDARIRFILFDFSRTTMMDSSGIGLITGRYQDMQRQGGCIYVTGVCASIDRILTLSGLYRIVKEWEE